MSSMWESCVWTVDMADVLTAPPLLGSVQPVHVGIRSLQSGWMVCMQITHLVVVLVAVEAQRGTTGVSQPAEGGASSGADPEAN